MYAEALMKELADWIIPNGYAKSVLLILASFTDHEGRCFPSIDTVSELTGFSRSTTIRALHWCEQHGLIVRSEGGRSTHYQFTCLMENDMTSVSQTPEDNRVISLEIRKKKKNTSSVSQTLVENMFDAFWSVYPRKISKGHARLAFRNKASYSDPASIVNGAQAYARFVEEMQIPQQYIPHPTTWLNGERWEDDLTAEKIARTPKLNNGWGDALDDL